MALQPTAETIVAVGKHYVRPLRHLGRARLHQRPRRVLGPVVRQGHEVRLRSPRLADAPDWCALRRSNRPFLEPYWVTSEIPWDERHTIAAWVEHCFDLRRAERIGRAVPLVFEVDGRFAGECNLEHIDPYAKSAQTGIWMSYEYSGRGITSGLKDLVLNLVFDTLTLHRLTAAICVDNVPARRLAESVGMKFEGTMTDYLDVGGSRRHHDLWAITAEDWRQSRREEVAPLAFPLFTP